ncbi:GntR family transcriptional regulator [Arsenicitalea aurantiaca]|uniref:GntR family transcriptional regulator n=1 Tax=Arsenicitalea aurantiaca TaxID=1783274 RepID=A0A433X476_9HYPH|nr:GntR family transcriptional regulator [Arsenicitalea aurantiaca]
MLGADVPKRHFDGCDGAVEDRAAACVLIAVHGLHEPLDVEGARTHDISLEHELGDRSDRLGLPLHGAFADPGDAGVGLEPHEQQIVPRSSNQKSLEAGELHGSSGPKSSLETRLYRILGVVYRILPPIRLSCIEPASTANRDDRVKPNLSHRLTEELRRDIVNGVFSPGERLKTEALAERYKVSANPVREALWRLQGEGFVVVTPNLGARVRVVDDDFIRNIFELREIIEPVFVRRFCNRASSDDLRRLEQARLAFERAAETDASDFYLLDRCNREFHRIMVEEETNTEALQVVERHGDIVNAVRSKLGMTRGRMLTRAREHAQIVKALVDADPDAAADAAARHVRNAKDDFLAQLRHGRTNRPVESAS